MSEWAMKRFWKEASVAENDGRFAVVLDGRPVKTPAKAPLAAPARRMAQAISAEWDAQEKTVDPVSMPFTRMANAALDKVSIQHGEVAQMLADYGDSDLLCYRADRPESLVSRQNAEWDPALDWAKTALGAHLKPRSGVMHAPQDAKALETLSARVHALDNFQLAAFHDLVTLTGSLVLGFAAAEGWRDMDTLWNMSMLDTLWQEEQWGRDEEAFEAAEVKRAAFAHAKRFFDLC